LIEEVELLCLFTHCVKELFVLVGILSVNILQLVCGNLVFLPELFNDLATVLDLILKGVVVLLFLEKSLFLSFTLCKELLLDTLLLL